MTGDVAGHLVHLSTSVFKVIVGALVVFTSITLQREMLLKGGKYWTSR